LLLLILGFAVPLSPVAAAPSLSIIQVRSLSV
jgi:hypothetical protein